MSSVGAFAEFVRHSDRTVLRARETRTRILRYGLVGELGSVTAAVKKRLLDAAGVERSSRPTDEIAEELGDVIWYCFALDRFRQGPDLDRADLLVRNLQRLREAVSAPTPSGALFRARLGPEAAARFLASADAAVTARSIEFDAYQELAYLTARSAPAKLVEVCLTLMMQFAAEVTRDDLPDYERQLNRVVLDRPLDVVLGEIMWHVAALATVFGLKLSTVVADAVRKLEFRLDRDRPTAFHDGEAPADQRLPRRFEINIVTVEPGRSQMYWDGKPLGDPLTDNAYDDDGYRFHDVMHLAAVAKLGWSPVIRKLMGRKRRHDPRTDEVEDGARAMIVEEAVIKLIHSEGVRLARERGGTAPGPLALFVDREEIGFAFLKLIRSVVAGLEVARNRDWEWEEAILAGSAIFQQLRLHGEGTVVVDMERREIAFDRSVPANLGEATVVPEAMPERTRFGGLFGRRAKRGVGT